MRLIDLPRTGSFRLSILFVALFGLSALLVFSMLYFETQHFIVKNIDNWLGRETPAAFHASPDVVLKAFAHHATARPGEAQIYSLYAPDGTLLSGSHVPKPPNLPAFDSPFTFTITGPAHPLRYRAIAHRYENGDVALVGQDLHETSEFDEAFVRTVIVGGGLTVLLGVLGAALMGLGTVRQMDAIAAAIHKIVKGDLSSRLPVQRGTSDINRLTSVINGMLDEIERLMHDVKNVADGIAHDLRTPLTRVLAGLERAQRRVLRPEEYDAVVQEAILELRAVLATFSALLRIAELEDGMRRAGFVTVDLAEVAADVAELYEPLAEEKKISLACQSSRDGPFLLSGDPSLLFDALANLVDNAIKFTPEGGQVLITLEKASGTCRIRVQDTGCGIEDAERDTIFQRFYRADHSRHAPGNGLGLSLVKAIAALHGLEVSATNRHPGLLVELAPSPHDHG